MGLYGEWEGLGMGLYGEWEGLGMGLYGEWKGLGISTVGGKGWAWSLLAFINFACLNVCTFCNWRCHRFLHDVRSF